jgi:RNA polymerase sigma factor (sigma-70 family)
MPKLPTDPGPAFPSTRWSRILTRAGPRDLQALALLYWRPIHAYLRARLRIDEDAARDLAQEAFAWMLATEFFDRADPARGRFRGLLKKALQHFAIEHLRKQAAGKRGGGHGHEPIEAGQEPADPQSRTPDQILDEEWRRELLERARELLEAELAAGGRQTYYLLFRDYFLDERQGTGGDEVDYAGLAARYGITRTDVSNWLAYAKRRYRELLRGLVQDTVSDEADLQEELRWLFGPAEVRQRGRA